MKRYDFEVLQDKKIIISERRVALADARAMWWRIGRIAKGIHEPGCVIRVTNAAGKIVVLVGVTTAIRLCADALLTLPFVQF
jgi:hypothetical protein